MEIRTCRFVVTALTHCAGGGGEVPITVNLFTCSQKSVCVCGGSSIIFYFLYVNLPPPPPFPKIYVIESLYF